MARRKKQSPAETLLLLPWQVSATLCLLSAVVGKWMIPGMLSGNKIFSSLGPLISTIAWLPIIAFGFIALVSFAVIKKGPRLNVVSRTATQRSSGPANPGYANSYQEAAHGRTEPSEHSVTPPDPFKVAWLAAKKAKEAKTAEWSLELLRSLEWKRYEDVCQRFYVTKGIKSNTTSLGADGGIDIKLFQDDQDPSKVTSIVQCKAWNQDVGVKLIRELLGVMASEKIAKGFFMSTSGFTPDAKAFAQGNGITLITGEMLLAMILRLSEEEKKALLAFATEGDYTTPSCPSCGTKMIARNSKKGKFWGCQNYPKCRQMINIRGVTTIS